jgi:hypothetical protein
MTQKKRYLIVDPFAFPARPVAERDSLDDAIELCRGNCFDYVVYDRHLTTADGGIVAVADHIGRFPALLR